MSMFLLKNRRLLPTGGLWAKSSPQLPTDFSHINNTLQYSIYQFSLRCLGGLIAHNLASLYTYTIQVMFTVITFTEITRHTLRNSHKS